MRRGEKERKGMREKEGGTEGGTDLERQQLAPTRSFTLREALVQRKVLEVFSGASTAYHLEGLIGGAWHHAERAVSTKNLTRVTCWTAGPGKRTLPSGQMSKPSREAWYRSVSK